MAMLETRAERSIDGTFVVRGSKSQIGELTCLLGQVFV